MIVLDPGHGGIYPGAVYYGIREADVNLSVALKLRDRLTALGATVLLTRTADVNLAPPGASLAADLQARVDVASRVDADMFVSLHANADTDHNRVGCISFYPTGKPQKLAWAIQTALTAQTGATDGGIRSANFYVLKNNQVPCVLIEMGFLSNQAEAFRLTDDAYQDLIADGLAKGILNYLKCYGTMN